MTFCFIFRFLGMGGTETLMIRMSKWLIQNGHAVIVLTPEDGEIRKDFPVETKWVIDRKLYLKALYQGKRAARNLYQELLKSGKIDVIYSFSNDALWIAAALVNLPGNNRLKCLAGVYVQGAYAIGPRVASWPKVASIVYPAEKLFQDYLPPSCRLYMNEAVKNYIFQHNGQDIPGIIWPLPVDGKRYTHIKRTPERGLIVSVGRLAPMKEYNLYMVRVIKSLVEKGYDVSWEIYGDGPMRQDVELLIKEYNLTSRVFLKGVIPYKQLADVYAKAHIFVGMGTALIEAGMAGVPSVAALAFEDSGKSYGLFSDLPGYTCGEPVDMQLRPIETFFINILNASEEEYQQLELASRSHAFRFDIDDVMKKFIEIVENAEPCDSLWRPSYLYYAAAFYQKMTRFYRSKVGRLDCFSQPQRPDGETRCENG